MGKRKLGEQNRAAQGSTPLPFAHVRRAIKKRPRSWAPFSALLTEYDEGNQRDCSQYCPHIHRYFPRDSDTLALNHASHESAFGSPLALTIEANMNSRNVAIKVGLTQLSDDRRAVLLAS